jgi:hypothetical protein
MKFGIRAMTLAGTLAGVMLTAGPLSANDESGICCLDPIRGAERSASAPPAARDSHDSVVLTFEGLGNNEPIEDYYDGGTGGDGSGPGPNLGITFSSNGLAIISQEAGGTGNFDNNPAGDTILFFLSGTETVMNVPDGFETGFSFFYSAANQSGFVRVYDEVGGQGNLLAELDLPVTPTTGDTPYTYDNWQDVGVSFDGVARSVDFGGTADQIGFDNVTLGSTQAGGGDPGTGFTPPPLPVPVGGGFWILLMAILLLITAPLVLRR